MLVDQAIQLVTVFCGAGQEGAIQVGGQDHGRIRAGVGQG